MTKTISISAGELLNKAGVFDPEKGQAIARQAVPLSSTDMRTALTRTIDAELGIAQRGFIEELSKRASLEAAAAIEQRTDSGALEPGSRVWNELRAIEEKARKVRMVATVDGHLLRNPEAAPALAVLVDLSLAEGREENFRCAPEEDGDQDRALWRRLFDRSELSGGYHEALDKALGPETAAEREGPVLVIGPPGTGKSRFAHAFADELRERRRRWGAKGADKTRLHPHNFGSTDRAMVDADIRGVTKGYASDVADRPGFFELADGGVLLLDDFQSATKHAQIRLLDLLSPLTDDVRVRRKGASNEGEPKTGKSKKDNPDRTQSEKASRNNAEPPAAMPEYFRVRVLLAINESLTALLKGGRLRMDLLSRARSVVDLSTEFNEVQSSPIRTARLARYFAAKHLPAKRGKRFSADDDDRLFIGFQPAAVKLLCHRRFVDHMRGFEKLIADVLWKFPDAIEIDEAMLREAISDQPLLEAGDQEAETTPAAPTSENTATPAERILDIVRTEAEANGWNANKLRKMFPQIVSTKPAMENWLKRYLNGPPEDQHLKTPSKTR